MPFLLLFLFPVSCFLFSLLLLYKVLVFMRSKRMRMRSHRHAVKGNLNEGYQPTQQIAAAETLDIRQQAPCEEDGEGGRYGFFPELEGLEGSNVQSTESCSHYEEGDKEGLCIPPSAGDFVEEKQEDIEEELRVQDGTAEDKIEEKQEEQDVIEDTLLEEDRKERICGDFPEDEGPEVSNVQNVESPASYKAEVETGLQAPVSHSPERESSFTEDKIEEKQEEQDVIEDTLSEEDRKERICGDFPENEGPEVSNVQNVESPESYKAEVEAGLQAPVSHSPERESSFTEETREDMGEALRSDMMEDNKQEEEGITEEVINFKDEQKHFPLYVGATSPRTSEDENWTSLPPDAPSSAPFNRQGRESLEDQNERVESSHMHPLEEAWRELPAIQIAESDFQAKTAVFPSQIVEKPWEGAHDEQLEIDTPFTEIQTQEHIREEPELSSEKDSSLENLGYKGLPDQKEDVLFPAEPFERKIEEGEPSCSLQEGHGQWRKEAFAKEMRDDVQPQKGRPPGVSFEAESQAEREEGYSCEATSSAVRPPQASHGGIEFQDRIQEEQKIMADINAIKKIVGYQGEPHTSIMEQISALYMFLGMEPYCWAAEVDTFEKAQAEIELLKVVVGVK